MTQPRVVAEIRGVQDEEQRGYHYALGRSSAADRCVRCDVLQPDVLCSVSEVVRPSRLGRIHWFAHFGRSLNQKVKQQKAFGTESWRTIFPVTISLTTFQVLSHVLYFDGKQIRQGQHECDKFLTISNFWDKWVQH